MIDYLVCWHVLKKTYVEERIKAESEEDARKKIIKKYTNYPGHTGLEVKVIKVIKCEQWWLKESGASE